MEHGKKWQKRDVLLINRHFSELNPIVAGQEVCESGYRFGPSVRKYVLLHCVLSGKGTYTCGGVVYPVAPGQIFRILPGEETVYRADDRDPWHYAWIGFDGALSGRMASVPPVFSVSALISELFRANADNPDTTEFGLAATLFRLYEELFADREPDGNEYVRRIRSYIDAMYMKKISVEGLADQLHLNRRYMTRIFHAETGMSVRDYLLRTRMREATECLRAGLSVGETAERCGYEDMFLFSKLFRKTYGVSPSGWKNRE